MKTLRRFTTPVLALALAASASAAPLRQEHVTNGSLDLVWAPGFGVSNNMKPLTLTIGPDSAGYDNPSGDHTVACATNSMAPDSGGIILTCTEPAGLSNYVWEGYMFTGAGNTRRGLVVRADPNNGFASCYQFVIQSGLFQLNFRKLVNGNPTTLATWFADILPGGPPSTNSWHHMKVVASGSNFRCFWDDFQLTSAPIVDTDLPSGWVGCYNFRFDLGNIPVYFDDLILDGDVATAATRYTWGELKARYAR
ncbi:MAG: hypothetical protein E6K73_00955 [Candidatus Eisenbacteria bacterium]|uniref:LamG domain-containing protein n=1 Tax=Eiseniibacteriota bacterium TaxID=2212470 RepID=A0A538SQK5_UNCEI|nr:MAG: hypothetical protein E6K73_00955 [Candidatus Eisenbacteria bacterium]